MSSVDKTPSTLLTAPSAMNTTTPEPSPTGWLTCTVTWKSESYATPESRHVSKGNPKIPSPLQPCKQPGTVYHEHSKKGQKRKCEAEGGNDMWPQELTHHLKKLKMETFEREMRCEGPGKGQKRNPHEAAGLHLKLTECTKYPEVEAVTEVKSMDGGAGPSCLYSSIEEGVHKHHNGMFSSLFGHLQPSGPECSASLPSLWIPVYASKKISGCVHGEIPASQPPQICTDRVSNAILSNQMPIPEAKEKAPEDQGKITGLDHGPLLTESMQKEISSALGPGPKDEILSPAFNLAVT